MDRKEFFKQCGRLTILSAMGVFGTSLLYHHKIKTPENCPIAPQCENCGKYNSCTLPQAKKERNDGR